MKVLGELLKSFSRPKAFPITPYVPLTEEQRQWFKHMIEHPTFKQIVNNVYCRKPTTAPKGTGVFATDNIVASNRLHQLQGWEMYEGALFMQAEVPIKPKQQIEENYPDAGTRIGE